MPRLVSGEFLWFWKDPAGVITDSGGLQEETTSLGIPCLTLLDRTERPIIVESGTNTIIRRDMSRLQEEAQVILARQGEQGIIPTFWARKSSRRTTHRLDGFLRQKR